MVLELDRLPQQGFQHIFSPLQLGVIITDPLLRRHMVNLLREEISLHLGHSLDMVNLVLQDSLFQDKLL